LDFSNIYIQLDQVQNSKSIFYIKKLKLNFLKLAMVLVPY